MDNKKICGHCKVKQNLSEFRYRNEDGRRNELRSWCRSCERKARSEYGKNNKDKINTRKRKDYEERDWVKNYNKKYREKHREMYIKCQRKRRLLLKKNGGFHTIQQWKILKDIYYHTCPSCGKRESTSRKFMLTQDHIKSLENGGTDDIDNIQPLCNHCNKKKGNKYIKYKKKIVLFYPHIPLSVIPAVIDTLGSRFLGQGPRVDEFEKVWEEQITKPHKSIAVGSGTDALHLAYILADIKEGDEVISPVFTCTATNTPLLYQRAKIKFADINKDNLNISYEDVKRKITDKTKAIIGVDYGGLPVDVDKLQTLADKYGIPFIQDAAQSQGALFMGRHIGSIADFTCFSFQSIKIITTADGGMLSIKNPDLEEKAKRIRWFGIDRKAKLEDRWKNDITEVGYKYQMTDIAATMGLEAMKIFDQTLAHHRLLFETYRKELANIPGITFIGDDQDHQSSCWLSTVLVERRDDLKRMLAENNIESNQVHYRNDMYTVFGGRVQDCPNMDKLESQYLVLPMHYHLTIDDIRNICDVIRKGW